MDTSGEQEIAGLLFGGTVVTLLLALALVAFVLVYQKKLVSQQLALQTVLSAAQKELLVATIGAEERERQRIGRDLHDEMGSSLSAANMLLIQLAESVAATAKEQELLALVREIVGSSLQNIRSISQNLHPAGLEQFGLTKALHHLGLVFAEGFAHGVEVRVEMDAYLAASHQLALYRIVQELLNNAFRHAQASRVTVLLRQLPHCLTLTVTDDGTGFDYAHAQQSNQVGLGLKSLAARVSLLDAALHLESAPGRGTAVRVEVPLASPRA